MVVGAGTTTIDSGLMVALEAEFASELSVVGGSTAEALQLAEQGAVSVAVVHDEAQELAFMASHPEARRAAAFVSSFLLVGPADQVAAMAAVDPAEAFAEIAANGWTFVTRDDESGTHSRELAIWDQAGVAPGGDWYLATGQGMGFTMQVADQRSGFTLVEEGAYLAAAATLQLVPVALDDSPLLTNRYSIIQVDPLGNEFFEWLTGPDGQRAVAAASERLFAAPVYRPSAESQ